MTRASIVATDISTLLYAHPGVALGALGMLASGAAAAAMAGASAANLSAGAGLSDPAFAVLVSAAIGVTVLLTLLTTQRFLRRRRRRSQRRHESHIALPQESVMLQIYVKASETLRKFAADTTGTTGIEYGLITAGIAITGIPAVGMLGGELSELFNTIRCDGFPPVCVLR